ncbi:putative palmitoyltransferase ZDHHC12-like, partial [Apostichopus japonicus]
MTDNIAGSYHRASSFEPSTHFSLLVSLTALCVTDTDLNHAYQKGQWLYLSAYLLLLILTSIFYFISCLLDPGYLPKQQYQVRKRTISLSSSSESSDEDEDEASRGEDARMLRKSKRSPTAVKLRKCPICKIEQPVRTKHCEDCQRCVRKYDHHCPWLENCVGERNHRYFWIFLLLQSALILWTVRIT